MRLQLHLYGLRLTSRHNQEETLIPGLWSSGHHPSEWANRLHDLCPSRIRHERAQRLKVLVWSRKIRHIPQGIVRIR
jgi:hypothetical protein